MIKQKSHQIFNDVQNLLLGSLHAVLGALDDHPAAVHPAAGEAHDHPAKVLRNLAQDLATAGHKVAVVFWVDGGLSLHNVVLRNNMHTLGKCLNINNKCKWTLKMVNLIMHINISNRSIQNS